MPLYHSISPKTDAGKRILKRLLQLRDKVFADKYAILTLTVTVASLMMLFAVRDQISNLLQVTWTVLATAANLIYQYVRAFRNKILFRDSKPLIKSGEGPKVLLWILDGCNIQAFLEVAENNRDLNLLYKDGYFAQCVSVFPSITPAAHSSMMTGCYPARTRVPAFDWVEEKTSYLGGPKREYIRCMPDFKRFQEKLSKKEGRKQFFKGLGDALRINQELLSPMVYTIFETLGEDKYTVSVKEWIHRGADNFIRESVNTVLVIC